MSSESTSRTRIGIAVPSLEQRASQGERVEPVAANARSQTKITVMLGRSSAGRSSTTVRLEPGQQVPSTPYRIVRWLGDGGMGVVYEAEHVALERRVALEVLRAEATGSVAETRMFRQEARTVSKIGSEHIVEVNCPSMHASLSPHGVLQAPQCFLSLDRSAQVVPQGVGRSGGQVPRHCPVTQK
jgi:hypothetical protein